MTINSLKVTMTILVVLLLLSMVVIRGFKIENDFEYDSSDDVDGESEAKREGSSTNCAIQYTIGEVQVCAERDKRFLIYKAYDPMEISPTWTYRGIDGPKEWHTIDAKLFNTDYPKGTLSMKKDFPLLTSKDPSPTLIQLAEDVQGQDEEDTTEAEQSDAQTSQKKVANVLYGPVPSFMRLAGYLEDNFCDGPMPSPINIDTNKAQTSDVLQEFEYTSMDVPFAIKMYFPEDGTNLLAVRIADDSAWGALRAPCISKGSIISGKDLCFDRLYIRYGVDPEHGSEHQLNKKSFAMELQFFFTLHENKESEYRSMSDFYYVRLTEYLMSGVNDVKKKKGKLVRALSVFVEVDKSAKTDKNLQLLANMARLFWNSDSDQKIRSFVTKGQAFIFKPFFPSSIYYAYRGSLTFPPCFPDLDWNIFEQPLKISPEDYEKFLFIPSEFDDTGYVAGNIRPINSIYVQMEDPQVNKDEESRKSVRQLRENRAVLKSTLSGVKKEDIYDYYEDNYGIRIHSWNLCHHVTTTIFIIFV